MAKRAFKQKITLIFRILFVVLCLPQGARGESMHLLPRQLLLGSLIAKSAPHQKSQVLYKSLAAFMLSPKGGGSQWTSSYQSWLSLQKDAARYKSWLPTIKPLERYRCLAPSTRRCKIFERIFRAIENKERQALLSLELPAIITSDKFVGDWLYTRLWILVSNALYQQALSLTFDHMSQDPIHASIYENLQEIYSYEQVSAGNVAIKAL